MEEQFEQIVRISPAYDQRHKGAGIGGTRLFMVLKGKQGCVVFTVAMGWYLPCTREWKELCIQQSGLDTWEPRGEGVSYCSPVPLHDYQKNDGRPYCDWLGCTCYGDTGYTIADEPFDLLLQKGSDAVWEWLANFYHKTFSPTTTTTP